MTPAQCGAVRALINMSHAELAGAAAVPLALIADFESGAGTPRPADVDRGRDAHYWAPPAQSRTCGFPAYGSHLG
jgi:hypothetical protein